MNGKGHSQARNKPAFPFQCASHEAREAQAFPSAPLGSLARTLRSALLPRRRCQGMPKGRDDRKLGSIIGWFPQQSRIGTPRNKIWTEVSYVAKKHSSTCR